jgi:outer membrane lipoprotein-sorting protein
VATIGAVLALVHDWAGRPLPARGSFRVDGARGTSRYRFWWLRPDCYRLEEVEGDEPGSVTVRRDREMWSVRGRRTYHRREVAGSLSVLDNLFMSSLGELGERPPVLKGTSTIAGRSAALVVAGSRWRRHSAEQMEAAVDLGTGMVLRRIQRTAGGSTIRMEIEETEIGAELPAELFNVELPRSVSVIELESKSAGFPMVEDLPILLHFQVWVANRPRDLQVVSVEADSSSVELVWVEDRGGERGVVVNAKEGKAVDEGLLAELEQVETDDMAVYLGIDKQKTPETWLVQFEKGGTTVRLGVRGSRDQALTSALGLIPLSGDRPELVKR